MEYMIVSGETLEALVNGVNRRLAEGWRVWGGPFSVDVALWAGRPKRSKGQLVAQALIKDIHE